MPVSIKLRRSAVQGQVPTTSNLQLGELAINTYDARVFVKGSTSGNETGAGTSIVQLFNSTGGVITGDVTLNAQSDLRFADSDSSNWVAFQAPATIASNVTWTLPSTDGTNGQVLSTNGTGTLSWATASGGTPGGSNTQVQFNNSGSFGGSADLTFASGTGTLGIKYGTFAAQANAPATPASGFTLYAHSGNALSWVGANGFIRTLDGTANTANRTYTLPNVSGTVITTGDTGTVATAMIANDAITYAKLQNVTSARLLGRSTAGSGDAEEISIGSGLTLSAGTLSASGGSGGATNLWIPASAWIPRTTGGCGVDSREIGATNRANVDELLFDTAAEEFAQALVVMPSNYNNGTITARFYWTAASGSGGVAWGISGRAFGDDDALDQASGTRQVVTDTFIVANDVHVTSATSAVTIDGTPAANKAINYQIVREVANASDTLGVDARLLGVAIIFS